MTLRALAATVTLFASSLAAPAQQAVPQFTDPANLRGERVKPRDGRELPIDQGARGLEQMLRRLNTRASLMLIVAHPDDEDGGMLTYYSRGLGARVATLTLTRGEGGQNAMTGDFEDALGLLRTQELLSADRYLGVDQFFGTEVDFGFSKTKEEAFKKWTHERVLYDAVRAIRLYRPLVIAAVFIGGVTDGHGQHQVSGQIAQEAFKAAADPTVFPDMIAEGILPWQALKVYARVPMQSISERGLFDYATGKYAPARFENYVTGEITTTTPSADVIVHEGTVDKLLSDNPSDPPRTYVQFARIGLGMQKSQIGGGVRVPPAGAFDVAYHLYGSALKPAPVSKPDTSKATRPTVAILLGPEAKAAVERRRNAKPKETPTPSPVATLPSFFDGIDTTLEGMTSLVPSATVKILPQLKFNFRSVAYDISEAQLRLQADHLELAAWQLSQALSLIDKTIHDVDSSAPEDLPFEQKENLLHELRIKRVQVNDALSLALGINFDSSMKTAHGDALIHFPVMVDTQLTSHDGIKLTAQREWLQNERQIGEDRGTENGVTSWNVSAPLPVNQQLVYPNLNGLNQWVTRPYFRRQNIEQPVYELTEPGFRNAPATTALTCWATIQYSGSQITLGRVVHDADQPIRFASDENIQISSRSIAVPKKNAEFSVSLQNLSRGVSQWKFAGFDTSLLSEPPFAWSGIKANQEQSYRFIVPSDHLNTAFEIPATVARLDGNFGDRPVPANAVLDRHSAEGYRPIGYGDLPRTNYYTPAAVRIVPVDLNLPTNKKIAYLPGTGDAVPEALASINLKPEIFTVADLTPAKLAQYDTVILGVRTYAAHPDLHGAPTQALFEFARNGGNVLVQYQTTEFTAADAPYPLSLGSNEKVVDETDPVQLLDAKAAFLTTPNKITPADFNNWVEERGHGFLSEWDAHYTALTETHDPDQDPQRGGLITTELGKGRWTYCAFALYRQLPEAVPGAFRLFVNLITPDNK